MPLGCPQPLQAAGGPDAAADGDESALPPWSCRERRTCRRVFRNGTGAGTTPGSIRGVDSWVDYILETGALWAGSIGWLDIVYRFLVPPPAGPRILDGLVGPELSGLGAFVRWDEDGEIVGWSSKARRPSKPEGVLDLWDPPVRFHYAFACRNDGIVLRRKAADFEPLGNISLGVTPLAERVRSLTEVECRENEVLRESCAVSRRRLPGRPHPASAAAGVGSCRRPNLRASRRPSSRRRQGSAESARGTEAGAGGRGPPTWRAAPPPSSRGAAGRGPGVTAGIEREHTTVVQVPVSGNLDRRPCTAVGPDGETTRAVDPAGCG